MLFLKEKDILEAVSFEEIINSVESAFVLYEKKEFYMPDRIHADYLGNTLLLMPCFTQKSFGTKLVALFPENSKRNIPVLSGVMILNDGKTGKPLALLDGSVLTALRTGAVGSVSVRYLAPADAKVLGIVGAGVQGFHQALFVSTVRNITDIYLFDIDSEKVGTFTSKFSGIRPEIQLHQAGSVEELLKKCRIIITATTSHEPVLPNEERLLEGRHFVGIGSYKPDMREFPEVLFKLISEVFIDTEQAVEESGDIVVPLRNHWIRRNQVFTLGQFIINKGKKKMTGGGTTLFKSVGMALFDLIVSDLIYKRAVEKGLGEEMNF